MNPVWRLTLLMVLCTLSAVQAGAHANSRIPVAFIEGFTGADPNTARELYRGVKIFLKKIPQAKKILRVEKIDNQGVPEETYSLMKEIAKRGLKIVVGLSKSDQAIVASGVATAERILFITPFATNVKVTQGAKSTFRMCFTDAKQGDVLARFAYEEFLPRRILALTNVDLQYSIGLSKQFAKAFGSYHSHGIIRELSYMSDNLRIPDVQKLVDHFNPDVVFIPDHITRSSILIREIHQRNPAVIFLGGDGWGGKKVFDAVYPKHRHEIRAYYSTHWHENIPTKQNREFISRYAAEYPAEPITSGAALTYDAFNLLWLGLKACNFEQNMACLTRSIEGISFSATTGSFRYGDAHNPEKNVLIIRISSSGAHDLYKIL